MKIKKIDIKDIGLFLKKLDVEKPGIKIMSKKSTLSLFFIKGMHVGAANILKQDALSLGADLAVPRGTIICSDKRVDALLIGTKREIEQLSRKELAQPFGLKELAKRLQQYLREKEYPLKIMGVINANEDSFYPGSRFKEANAIKAVERMIEEGADIIDIGGVSSRPGSEPVNEEDELQRVKPVIDVIYSSKLYEKALFSIDSFRPKVIEYALQRGFKIANDITGLKDEEVAKIVAKHDAKAVIMHMKGEPKTMQKNPEYEDVVIEISDFFEKRLEKAEFFGIKRENIILDPGIGFGKKLQHNLEIIRDLSEFKRFGCEILVGASRKSMIDMIVSSSVEERLPGSLALHMKAYQNGASIIRCHDVKEHFQALEVLKAVENI
ncbi:dihydropteroate synthase [Nitrosophilus alvini]|uniref:dihydropteroate synthase n=1 Tax=Nitrosophilus alvini TaxID=2714855 RepID=UPI00190DB340|nr:dihydropteroate synthase [Nitrosophilus alvini]